MKLLEERIKRDGIVLDHDVLKVNSFLNHQIDPQLMLQIGDEFAAAFEEDQVTKIVTVESSGIAPALMAGLALNVPVVFARKHKSLTLVDHLYTADVYSYTKKVTNTISVDQKFLTAADRILIIDDFLANGQAVTGLLDIAKQVGCEVAGVGIVIEKTYQQGAQLIKDAGIKLVSLARIDSLADHQVHFAPED